MVLTLKLTTLLHVSTFNGHSHTCMSKFSHCIFLLSYAPIKMIRYCELLFRLKLIRVHSKLKRIIRPSFPLYKLNTTMYLSYVGNHSSFRFIIKAIFLRIHIFPWPKDFSPFHSFKCIYVYQYLAFIRCSVLSTE
jgi:hypothetical protein